MRDSSTGFVILGRMLSRRALLGGGAVAAGVGVAGGVAIFEGALPGRPQLQEAFGLNGTAGEVPDDRPGPVVSGSFVSRHRLGERTGWTLARPPGRHGDDLPLVLLLHGMGWDHRSPFGRRVQLPRYLADAVHSGVPPFQVAAVDGGRSYWHPRPDGEDARAMVTEEFLPLLQRHGVPTERIALMGWSMGGFGALHLAATLGPDRVAAVAAASPAIWRDPADSSRAGFDDEAEYEAYTLFGRQDELAGIPLMIDCGTGDGLYREVEAYVAGFPPDADVTSSFDPGAHDADYWRRLLPDQLAFLGEHLAG